MNKPFLCAATNFWIPTRHVFQLNGVELCPTLEEFGAIMGEHNFNAIILPTLEEDLFDLTHQILGVPLAMAKRWCNFDKLDIQMVFKYFSQKDIPLVGVKLSRHLNAFYLYILPRYFLVHKEPHVDPRIL